MRNPLVTLFELVHSRRVRALASIPGPAPSFPFGNALEFVGRRRPWEVCADCGRQYGGMSLVWLMGTPAVVLNDPELIAEVLVTNREAYYKDAPRRALLPISREHSLFLANGAQWESARADDPMSSEGFDDWLASRLPAMQRCVVAKLQAGLAGGEGVKLLPFVQRMTFDALAESTLGIKLDDATYRRFLVLGNTGSRRIQSPLSPLPPLSPWFWRARRKWFETFGQIVADARKGGGQGDNDLVRRILRQRTRLTDEMLRDALANMFFGGVFSMTSGILSTLYLLATHPEHRRRVGRELADNLPGEFDLQALDACRLLDASLREAMRIYAPVPLYFRNVNRESATTLGGVTLPPDTLIMISNWALQRSDRHWERADEFIPDRWLAGGLERDPIGSGYFFPFGRGPRMCVGAPYAMVYMRVALAVMLAGYDYELLPPTDYRMSLYFGVMRPTGLRARFASRGK